MYQGKYPFRTVHFGAVVDLEGDGTIHPKCIISMNEGMKRLILLPNAMRRTCHKRAFNMGFLCVGTRARSPYQRHESSIWYCGSAYRTTLLMTFIVKSSVIIQHLVQYCHTFHNVEYQGHKVTGAAPQFKHASPGLNSVLSMSTISYPFANGYRISLIARNLSRTCSVVICAMVAADTTARVKVWSTSLQGSI